MQSSMVAQYGSEATGDRSSQATDTVGDKDQSTGHTVISHVTYRKASPQKWKKSRYWCEAGPRGRGLSPMCQQPQVKASKRESSRDRVNQASPSHTGAGAGRPRTGRNSPCYEETVATHGSMETMSQGPPVTEIADEDVPSSSSQPLAESIDPQDLLDLLHEFDEETRKRKREKEARGAGHSHKDPGEMIPPQCEGALPDHEKAARNRTQQCFTRRKGSPGGGAAQPPVSTRNFGHFDTAAPTSGSNSGQRTSKQLPRAGEDAPPAENHPVAGLDKAPPDSTVSSIRRDHRYRHPKLFIGRLSSSQTGAQPEKPKVRRRRKSDRPDIRGLPSYDEDPIDEEG